MTVSAGVIGLVLGREFAVQPLVAGLLLALAAGMLALALTRITLFVLGGLCAILVVRIAVPSANEFLCFVVGGLVGICFYQLWITALSSLLGSVLMAYSVVTLMNSPGKFDSVAWATQNAPLVNWAMIGCTVLGILTQFILDRRRAKKKIVEQDKKAKEKQVVKEKDKELKELKVEKLEKELAAACPGGHRASSSATARRDVGLPPRRDRGEGAEQASEEPLTPVSLGECVTSPCGAPSPSPSS